MLPPVITPAKPPRRRKRKPAIGVQSPPTALVITGIAVIYYDEGTQILYVEPTLNVSEANPLVNLGAAAPDKWIARYNGMAFVGMSIAQTTVNQIEIQFDFNGSEPGPDTLIYTNNPSDIEDESGRSLAAFEMPLA
jgi:hypothetical protein